MFMSILLCQKAYSIHQHCGIFGALKNNYTILLEFEPTPLDPPVLHHAAIDPICGHHSCQVAGAGWRRKIFSLPLLFSFLFFPCVLTGFWWNVFIAWTSSPLTGRASLWPDWRLFHYRVMQWKSAHLGTLAGFTSNRNGRIVMPCRPGNCDQAWHVCGRNKLWILRPSVTTFDTTMSETLGFWCQLAFLAGHILF